MTAPWQRAVTFMLALALMAGCAKPSTPPQTNPPPAAVPAPGVTPPAPEQQAFAPGSGCAARTGDAPSGGVGNATVTEGVCQAYLHADPAFVTFRLPPDVTEQTARDSLQVAGAMPEKITFRPGSAGSYLTVHLPEGEVGADLTIQLDGPVGVKGSPHSLGFKLKRLETPRITTEVRLTGGEWQPLTPGATLPQEPMALRFTLVGQPKRERVEFAISVALRHKGAPSSYALAWEGEERLVVTLNEPPPAVFFRFDWLEAEHGLQVRRSALAFYTGQAPPQLVALDPATGEEQVVGEVPVDVLHASLSPDARWLQLTATAPDAAEKEQVWVMDTRSSERWLTGFASDWVHWRVHWLPNRMLLPTYRGVQAWDLREKRGRHYETTAVLWGPLSPDGHYLAGSAVHQARGDGRSLLAPASIIIFDLNLMAERAYADVATAAISQSSRPAYVPLRWSDDAEFLFFEDLLSHQPRSSRWRSLKLARGEVSDADLPAVKKSPPPDWPEASSGWAHRPASDWGEIILRSPRGEERPAGQGLAVGWRPDGRLLLIRWENFQYLRRPEGI